MVFSGVPMQLQLLGNTTSTTVRPKQQIIPKLKLRTPQPTIIPMEEEEEEQSVPPTRIKVQKK